MATWNQRSGLEVERNGDVLVVRDVAAGTVHQLTGDQIAAFEWAEGGQDPALDHLREALASLASLGLVESDARSRRRVLTGGAAALALGIAAAAGLRAVSGGEAVAAASGGSAPAPRTPTGPTTLDVTYDLVAPGTGGQRTGTQSAIGVGGYAVTVGSASEGETTSSISFPTPVTVPARATGSSGESGAGSSGYHLSGAGGSGYHLSGAGSTGYNLSGAGSTGYHLSGAGSTGYHLSGAGSTGYHLSEGSSARDVGDRGVVVISYSTPSSGVAGKGGTVTVSGGTTYHRFDRSGTFTVS